MMIAVKCDGEGSTRNLQKIDEGKREEDTTHLSQIVHQILKQNHLTAIVIVILILIHHTIALQVMTGGKGERNPLRGISIGVERGKGIESVIKGVGVVIGNQGANPNGPLTVLVILKLRVQVKVVLRMIELMIKDHHGSLKDLRRCRLRISLHWWNKKVVQIGGKLGIRLMSVNKQILPP